MEAGQDRTKTNCKESQDGQREKLKNIRPDGPNQEEYELRKEGRKKCCFVSRNTKLTGEKEKSEDSA